MHSDENFNPSINIIGENQKTIFKKPAKILGHSDENLKSINLIGGIQKTKFKKPAKIPGLLKKCNAAIGPQLSTEQILSEGKLNNFLTKRNILPNTMFTKAENVSMGKALKNPL